MVVRLKLLLLSAISTHAFVRPATLLAGRCASPSAPTPPLSLAVGPARPRRAAFLQAAPDKLALPGVDLDPADPDAGPVVLRDAATGRAIACFLRSYATVAGELDQYVVGTPVDPCVVLCKVDAQTDELATVDPDGPDMDVLFPVAAALLAEADFTLLRSAATATMQGDIELDEDEDEDDELEKFPPDKEIAAFEHDGGTYCMIMVGMPLLLIAKAVAGAKGEYVLLNDGDNERVATAIQAQVDVELDVQTGDGIRPAAFFAGLGPTALSADHLRQLRRDGYTVVDHALSPRQVAAARAACLGPSHSSCNGSSGSLAFAPAGNSAWTRSDVVSWLWEGDPYVAAQPALHAVVLLLKGVAAELEAYHIKELGGAGGGALAASAADAGADASAGKAASAGDVPPSVGPPWSGLEVPSRVMASVYGGQNPQAHGSQSTSTSTRHNSSTGESSRYGGGNSAHANVGYLAHRDLAPPNHGDAYWRWKADREVSERAVTAILYLNGPQEEWWAAPTDAAAAVATRSIDRDVGSNSGNRRISTNCNSNGSSAYSGCGGGALRLFVGAVTTDNTGTGVPTENIVDVAPAGGRLVLFDSRSMLHAVTPLDAPPGSRRVAVSCWILRA